MQIICENCGKTLNVLDGREVSYVEREASTDGAAEHFIAETSPGGTWLIHRCLVTSSLPTS